MRQQACNKSHQIASTRHRRQIYHLEPNLTNSAGNYKQTMRLTDIPTHAAPPLKPDRSNNKHATPLTHLGNNHLPATPRLTRGPVLLFIIHYVGGPAVAAQSHGVRVQRPDALGLWPAERQVHDGVAELVHQQALAGVAANG